MSDQVEKYVADLFEQIREAAKAPESLEGVLRTAWSMRQTGNTTALAETVKRIPVLVCANAQQGARGRRAVIVFDNYAVASLLSEVVSKFRARADGFRVSGLLDTNPDLTPLPHPQPCACSRCHPGVEDDGE